MQPQVVQWKLLIKTLVSVLVRVHDIAIGLGISVSDMIMISVANHPESFGSLQNI